MSTELFSGISWECPVCMTVPEGEVHQCHEGHHYCFDCWNRLEEPRRCPVCRQPVPQANRNRGIEQVIATLDASCEHCGEIMRATRGAKAAHLAVCPKRPTACTAAAEGCRWAGVLAEQVAEHEAACPFVRARVAAQNQLHDAPPSDAEVEEMGLTAAVAALWAHVAVPQVVEKACERLNTLCVPAGGKQAAAEAGAIEAAVAAMRSQRVAASGRRRWQAQVVGVQAQGCALLSNICAGHDDPAGQARRQKAAAAKAIEVVVAAMRAHPQVADVQVDGCRALGFMCYGTDAAAHRRRQRAAAAGAIEVVVTAMQDFSQEKYVQYYGCGALFHICGGGSGMRARQQRATQAGGRTVVVAAMQAHPDNDEMQRYGQRLLGLLPAEL